MNKQTGSLIRIYADGTIAADQIKELERTLRSDATAREQFLRELHLHAALEEMAIEASVPAASRDAAPDLSATLPNDDIPIPARTIAFAQMPWAVATVAVVALVVSVYWLRPISERPIVTISGFGGSILWTGDGGRVTSDVSIGDALSGGTIEGMTPDSWFEMRFDDGSTIMIAGKSMLTVSDFEQKELRLREGRLTANVMPQPEGKPMWIHTRAARLEVLGTRFGVDAGLASTALVVNEGQVRATRLVDGSSVDVPAGHRAIAAADRDLTPTKVPEPVRAWQSRLEKLASNAYGAYSPGLDGSAASLKAIPYCHTTPQGNSTMLYQVALPVSHGDAAPVILRPDSRIRVRGRLAVVQNLAFGITGTHPDGTSAGSFFVTRPATEFDGRDEFDVIFKASDLQLVPELAKSSEKPATEHADVVVEWFWCNTAESDAGLEILDIAIFDADADTP